MSTLEAKAGRARDPNALSVDDRIMLSVMRARVNQLESAQSRVASEVAEADRQAKYIADSVSAELAGKAPPPPPRAAPSEVSTRG